MSVVTQSCRRSAPSRALLSIKACVIADYVRLPQEGYSTGPARRRSSSVRLLAEWRALIANMTAPELCVPPALTSAHHHIDLDRRAQRQRGHADRGAGRVGLGE